MSRRSEVDRKTFLLPVTVAHGLRAIPAAQFPGHRFGHDGARAARIRLFQRAPGHFGQFGATFRFGFAVFLRRLGHDASLFLTLLIYARLAVRQAGRLAQGYQMADQPTAREGAVWLLGQVLDERRLLSELLGDTRHQRLPAPERARAQRLATDTMRGLERADRVLKPYLRKQPPPMVRNILRVATAELCQGGDAHGVVNEAVTLVQRNSRTRSFGGLVNAVLRKVADKGAAKWAELRIPHLPKWLRGPLRDAYGPDVLAAIEAAHFGGAPVDITPRAGGGDWAERLNGDELPTGSIRLANAGQVSALPGFEDGSWWVQDAAAALPVRGLGQVSGLSVLDMCAAPGGKTLQLAAANASVTALDLSESRLLRLRENLTRTGLAADIVVGDALVHDGGPYDAIVLDAPCSATGTIRRHPDLPLARDGAEIGALIELQAAMLDHALSLLKPGGRLVYCTCSLIPDEGECQIEDALTRHKGLRVVPGAFATRGIEPGWHSAEGGLRLRPDFWAARGGMDGFYMCCLHKP